MNRPALSPVLATACLASLTAVAYAETEPLNPELQKGPDDFIFTGELLNKDYDQGRIDNNNVTAHGGITGRFFDVGVHLDGYLAVGGDNNLTPSVKSGETTRIDLGADYLIEMKDQFQIIPHYQFETYPNLPNIPYKDDQHWFGIDGWYLLPWPGLEVGTGFDYNPFYNSDSNAYRGNGGLSGHDFRWSVGGRQFLQHSPLDLTFWELINLGNASYKEFVVGDSKTGFTTLDLGVKYTAPFYLNEIWTVVRLEAHFWLEHKDRDILRAQGKDTTEIVIGLGFEYRPD